MKKPVTIAVGIVVFIFLLMVGCSIVFSSCTSMKKSHKVTSDSTQVRKEESGSVSKNGGESLVTHDWYKDTYLYPSTSLPAGPGQITFPQGTTMSLTPINLSGSVDTVKLQSIYNTQPIAIIREGGNFKDQRSWYNWDSAFQAKLDSISVRFSEKKKSSSTQVLSFWQLLGIALIGPTLMFLLQIGQKFKIVRKQN